MGQEMVTRRNASTSRTPAPRRSEGTALGPRNLWPTASASRNLWASPADPDQGQGEPQRWRGELEGEQSIADPNGWRIMGGQEDHNDIPRVRAMRSAPSPRALIALMRLPGTHHLIQLEQDDRHQDCYAYHLGHSWSVLAIELL